MGKEQLIEQMITDVMDDFDFKKVHDIMEHLNWKWCVGGDELVVPSIYCLMKEAERILREVASKDDESYHYVLTGGFLASYCNGMLSLQFVLAEATTDRDFYSNEEANK